MKGRAEKWIAAALLVLAGWPATAQEATQQDPATQEEEQAAPADKTPIVGEEIVVTARKREENLQEVPIAVTAISGERLDEASVGDISELESRVPSISIYEGRNQSTTLTAFIRGIGQADPLWGVDPGVGLYFDDVYIARPQGALLDVFDVERIEVLRGPQGTLYGKNTIGGAIKYVSKRLTDQRSGLISVTPGTDNNLDVRASLGGALIPGKLRGRIAVAQLQHDGYGENLYTGRDVSDKDTFAARGALEFLPSDRVSVLVSADITRDKAEPKGYQRLQANPFCPLFLGAPCPPNDSRWDTQSGLAPLNGTDSSGGAVTVAWQINDAWDFKSISAYRKTDSENNIDFDTTPAPITDVIATYYDKQFSQELQFIYGGDGFSGVFGVYYFDGEAGGLVKNNFLNLQFGTTDGKTLTDSFALFGDWTWAVGDFNVNMGLRATREKKNGIAFNAGYANAQFETPIVIVADYDKDETFDSLAPKLGFDYRFTEDVMGYVTYSRGFKSGGFNVRAQSNIFPESAEPFDDEILDVFEAGVKSVLADRTLVLNLAAYYGKYKDVQVSTFTAYDSNGDGTEDSFFGNFLNAGKATTKGVEAEFDWTLRNVDWLGFNGFVSWLDAEADGLLDSNNDGFVDTQVITNAPEWTAGIRANFDWVVGGGLMTASAGAAFRDDSTLTNEGGSFAGQPVHPLTQEAFWLYDAWVSWLSPNAKWRFGITGKNLTDEEYLTNGYNIPALGIRTGSYGAPRTVLGTIEYRFF